MGNVFNSIGTLFYAQNRDDDILAKSSSGGVFLALAKYVIGKNGVVFGASWNKEWLVDINYSETIKGCEKFMTSKYLLADASKSYRDCKRFLDNGRLVLYTGIPCQNHGLKKFLKKSYDNLVLVDVTCHGLPSIQVWKDYFNTIKKPHCAISNINFRDKTYGWKDYSFKVEYDDGTTFIESHKNNKYMRAFLSDNYLRECCYNCCYKNKNSCADIIIGDFWTIENVAKHLYNDKGNSFIISKTSIGHNIIKNIKKMLILEKINYTNDVFNCVGIKRRSYIKKLKYSKEIFEKRVGIINNSFQSNMGGTIQTYALQQVLNNLGYKSFAYNANLSWSKYYLKFIDDNINVTFLGEFDKAANIPYSKFAKEEDLTAIIVGSDQIWRKEWNSIDNVFLTFASSWNINKIIYGASMGTENWNFNIEENGKIKKSLKLFNGVSVREIDLINKTKKELGITPTFVLDPSFLLPKSHYEKLCCNVKQKNGVFLYILDENEEIKKIVNVVNKKIKKNVFTHNKEILEEWLAGFRDADIVITDSYHGCVFSIIFNKPFICILNKKRGLARFKSLEQIFNLNGRFISSYDEIAWDNVMAPVDCNSKIVELRQNSIKFIKSSLEAQPKRNRAKLLLSVLLPKNTIRRKVVKRIYNAFKCKT